MDHENGDFPVFESGAIMMYLCDRFDTEGKLFPKEGKQRHEVIQWLMFQMVWMFTSMVCVFCSL